MKSTWVHKDQDFLWLSERDGWRHAYLVSRDGKRVQLITTGAYDVTEICGVDEKASWLYFIASPENATQRYLYRARLGWFAAAPSASVPPLRLELIVTTFLPTRTGLSTLILARTSRPPPISSSFPRIIQLACLKITPHCALLSLHSLLSHRILQGGYRRRRHPRRLDAQASAFRSRQKISRPRLRLWRTCGANRPRRMGRMEQSISIALSPRPVTSSSASIIAARPRRKAAPGEKSSMAPSIP